MARFVRRLAWIGAVSVLVASAPATDVAQAAGRTAGPVARAPLRTAAAPLRTRAAALEGGRQGFLYGVSFRSATSGWAVGLCRACRTANEGRRTR